MIRLAIIAAFVWTTVLSTSHQSPFGSIRSALSRRSCRRQQRYVLPVAGEATSEYLQRSHSAFLRTRSPAVKQQHHYRDEASVLLGDSNQPLTTTPMNIIKRNQRTLSFIETMICGAVSRSVAQTVMHPFNTMKTILQSQSSSTLAHLLRPTNWPMLMRGAGAQMLLSVPNGAVNFAVIEFVRARLAAVGPLTQWSAGLDFCSSCLATITCSAVSTPQMMICDNIMAGNYPNLVAATRGLVQRGGLYAGWWPGLVGKIPSYALTWTLFQELKRLHASLVKDRPAHDWENSAMGCLASATCVCVMIPVDTIKTRLVTQAGKTASERLYKGIIDCAVKTFQSEGIGAFYRGLPPRLVSVVPMIGIQFGVYEAMKKLMHRRQEIVSSREIIDEF